MPVQPRSRASGERGRAVASATALTVCSSVRIAMPRKPYFALMTSPCSVTRKRPRTERGGALRIALAILPPPRLTVPPRP